MPIDETQSAATSENANAAMMGLLIRFLEAKGLLVASELFTFFEQSADAWERDGSRPEFIETLRRKIAQLRMMGTVGVQKNTSSRKSQH